VIAAPELGFYNRYVAVTESFPRTQHGAARDGLGSPLPSRVLLISLNRSTTPDPVFPLGLSFVNAALRRAGCDTRWLDCLTDPTTIPEAVADYRPDFVGLSLRNIDDVQIRRQETYFEELTGVCEAIRRTHRCRIVLGGSGYSLFPGRLLELSGADFGIQGEAEASFPALIRALNLGEDYSRIAGLVFRRQGTLGINPPPGATVEIRLSPDDRPAPLTARYLESGGMLNLQTQRGCSQFCTYCTYPIIEGPVTRRRAPEAVADEMAQLEAAGARYAFIVDSVFNSSPRHVVEVCEALLHRGITLRWACFLRPQGLTPELMKLMARAGLRHIEFGSDSFCDPVLASYAKRLTFADILRSSELAKAEGIDYCHYLICGGPGESEVTLATSFENSQRLPDAVVMAVVGMRIYPGTALARLALREGRIRPETDLLYPTYYVAPGLDSDGVFARLASFARASPNWIVGSATPAYGRLVERLRARGVPGPLWSYFAMLQRLRPALALLPPP
jgi:radical SAM superfamily enzyme YgiQ (UPF0313 family)